MNGHGWLLNRWKRGELNESSLMLSVFSLLILLLVIFCWLFGEALPVLCDSAVVLTHYTFQAESYLHMPPMFHLHILLALSTFLFFSFFAVPVLSWWEHAFTMSCPWRISLVRCAATTSTHLSTILSLRY